ncbi:hypothetical protein CLCR_11057 [Cladophialophora carrionii]|uniref:Uncharacterized protein n=1 Tax=Cladophialophora carrionii TaxID=86049 RepID=A0A1C1CYM0_9EURO|nr:hypothetical protein CLCR_11057 [Cladophialophora carrionii]
MNVFGYYRADTGDKQNYMRHTQASSPQKNDARWAAAQANQSVNRTSALPPPRQKEFSAGRKQNSIEHPWGRARSPTSDELRVTSSCVLSVITEYDLPMCWRVHAP